LLFFTLPGAIPAFFLIICIPKLFQNMIFSLVPNPRLLGPSRSFPCQVQGEALEELRWGHEEKGLQSQECGAASVPCCAAASPAMPQPWDIGQNSTYLAESGKPHTFPDLMGNISNSACQNAMRVFAAGGTSLHPLQNPNLGCLNTANKHEALTVQREGF